MPNAIYGDKYEALLTWLKRGRRMEGVSIRGLAELTDQPKSVIGRIETGERRLDVVEFVEICIALDLDPKVGIGELYEALKREAEG
jgi:transcriptional regulator with XRE-family HTH domain